MPTRPFIQASQKAIKENAPAIMTTVSVVGVASTALLTARASFKASQVLQEEKSKLQWDTIEDPEPKQDLELKEKIKLTWPIYIPPATIAAITVANVIMLNRTGARRAAAATALYTVTDKAFTEYKAKVVEKIGETKEQTVRDEVAQDNVTKNPPKDREVIITGSGDVLCYDTITGRYFNSDIETIRKSQNDINQKILNDMYASLSEFYDLIGLAPTPYSEDVGWNVDDLLDLSFSTTLTEDGRPCVSMDYRVAPIVGYVRLF